MCDLIKTPFCTNNRIQTSDNTCGGPYNEPSIQCRSGADLDTMPQCQPRCPPPRSKCITIQQPAHLICKKAVLYLNKTKNEPMIVNRCKQVSIPKIIHTTKLIKVPKLTWITQIVKEPRIIYYPSVVPDPYIVCFNRSICEPREVCQMLLCQPKPQVIDVPPPTNYCCYMTGSTTIRPSVMCPPNIISQNDPCGPMKCRTPCNTLSYQNRLNGSTVYGNYQPNRLYSFNGQRGQFGR